MTSNIAESLNSRNNKARELPVVALLEALRSLCQEWSHNLNTIALHTVTKLTQKYHKILLMRMIESKKLTVRSFSFFKFQFFVFNLKYTTVHNSSQNEDKYLYCR